MPRVSRTRAAGGGSGSGSPQALPSLACITRAGLARPPVPQRGLGRGLSVVRGSLAPPAATVGGTARQRARPRHPSSAPAVGDTRRVHRVEDLFRQAAASRPASDDLRARVAKARSTWLETTLALSRIPGPARQAGVGGGRDVAGAPLDGEPLPRRERKVWRARRRRFDSPRQSPLWGMGGSHEPQTERVAATGEPSWRARARQIAADPNGPCVSLGGSEQIAWFGETR